jgi:holo-ACP synthase
MSYEKLQHSIIAARDQRQELLTGYLTSGYAATIVISLNIPGPDKNPPGVQGLFSWAFNSLDEVLPTVLKHSQPDTVLGPYGLMLVNLNQAEVKRHCIAVETAHPFCRLLDLDVYDATGRQVDRASLDMPPRSCFVCDLPAVECIRFKRHSFQETTAKTHEFLAHFRA